MSFNRPTLSDLIARARGDIETRLPGADSTLRHSVLDVLARMHRLATSKAAREHVTILPRSEMPGLFLCHSVTDAENNADLRWTVDTEADLRMVERVYEGLRLDERCPTYREVLRFVRTHPEISDLNKAGETWTPEARR